MVVTKQIKRANTDNRGKSFMMLRPDSDIYRPGRLGLLEVDDLFEEDELSAEDELFDGRLPLAGTDDLKDGTEREEVDGIDL
ncbi:MAG TPA: hypothetical protein DHV39_01960 [Verrucomicrobiales bacterium]|nr:hypothetical protein [Verrucomicrobiales bacterium]HCZ02165.1 hypothetical protein [Verrucomicrobiales bacterium]|tara:strand:- start:597 stop:842 length:246 start_codon:yes stop_codon:yes gene_type:complete